MDEAEMSQILKEAFRLYAYQIAQACNVPTALKPLVNGATANVSVQLTKGNTLLFSECVLDETCEKKLRACRKTVKMQKATIEKLQATIKKVNAEPLRQDPVIGDTVYHLSHGKITEG